MFEKHICKTMKSILEDKKRLSHMMCKKLLWKRRDLAPGVFYILLMMMVVFHNLPLTTVVSYLANDEDSFANYDGCIFYLANDDCGVLWRFC